ncbi:MAG: hypothetical protein ACRECY_15585, partial [Phyllobacterium sp.]
MRYISLSKAEFFVDGQYNHILGEWNHQSNIPDNVKKIMLSTNPNTVHDYFTPLERGKDWLFELTCKYQPYTGRLLMQGGEIFVRATGESLTYNPEYPLFLLKMGLEVRGKVILLYRNTRGYNPSDPDYRARIEQENAWLTKRDGRPLKAEERHLSLPLPIREAYYTRFDGLNIPDSDVVSIYPRFLPRSTNSWNSWDNYLSGFRGYKKKYLPWLEEHIPDARPRRMHGRVSYNSFMMFMAAGPNPYGRDGDVFFVK